MKSNKSFFSTKPSQNADSWNLTGLIAQKSMIGGVKPFFWQYSKAMMNRIEMNIGNAR